MYRNFNGLTSVHSSNITSAADWGTTNISYFTNNSGNTHKYLIVLVSDVGDINISITGATLTYIGGATFVYPSSFYLTSNLTAGARITIPLNKQMGAYILQIN